MSLVPHIKNPQKADHETPSISENGLVFKSPTTSLWVGSTGSGKTNAMLAAIAHQAQWRKYDQIFLMSPNVEATQKGEYSLLEPHGCWTTAPIVAQDLWSVWGRMAFWTDLGVFCCCGGVGC
eukprot:COSAG01_NODE_1060_length_11890_cov_17.763973_9_plen_122_part_00